MKIKDILIEAPVKAEVTAAELIVRDCGPYLAQLGDPRIYKLYRGISTRGIAGFKNFTFQATPIDRSPKDTDPTIHKLADEFFLKTTGVRFRSNATFAIHNIYQATEFGQAFVIFPRGDFKFCWSPLVDDMTFGPLGKIAHHMRNYYVDNVLDIDSLRKDVEEVLTDSNYQTSGLKEAISADVEVMIHAPRGCYLVKTNEEDDDDEYDISKDFYTKVVDQILRLKSI